MKKISILLKTPSGSISIHTVFKSMAEAERHGWYKWFRFERYIVLARSRRSGAVVEIGNRAI